MPQNKAFHETQTSPSSFSRILKNKVSVIVLDSHLPINTGEPIKIWEQHLATRDKSSASVIRVITRAVRCYPAPEEPHIKKRYILTLEAI